MAVDMDVMLAQIKDRQWALADIDWYAPGAETISDEFRPKLKAFMADLCWIENVGARGFAALAKKAPTPVLAEIYRYFHAEEQRHANAELALMKRWGMLEDGEMPEPNVNIRLAIDWLDTYADDMSLSVLGRTEQAVSGAGWSSLIVLAMIGGAMVPPSVMPDWLLQLSNLSPVKWGIWALEGATWRALSWSELLQPLSMLSAFGLASFAAGVSVMTLWREL